MLPIQFALELETSISNRLTELLNTDTTEGMPAIVLINRFQQEFSHFLSEAANIDVDSAPYPILNEALLLGSDAAWQQVSENTVAANASLQTLITLWSVYIAIDKSIQFYQQASANSAHPQSRLFFSSLSHIKKILRRRLDGIIQIYCNRYWGELGFAPFMLGKD